MELHHSWLYGHKSTCLNTEMFTILIGMELIVWILQPTLLLHYWLLPLHNLDFARHSPWENTITQKTLHYLFPKTSMSKRLCWFFQESFLYWMLLRPTVHHLSSFWRKAGANKKRNHSANIPLVPDDHLVHYRRLHHFHRLNGVLHNTIDHLVLNAI